MALAPASAQAGVGGDVLSFFGTVASDVKSSVAALPEKVAALPETLGISRARAQAPAAPVAPSLVLAPAEVAVNPDLSQVKAPAVAMVRLAGPEPSVETPLHRLFCVEYARARSGLAVFGDAKFWWDRAKNLYGRASEPVEDAVMVFSGSSRIKRGHVAVVTEIISPREIRVDQANWQNHGEIEHATPVLDVSRGNDWSRVRVWDIRSRQYGRIYAVSGFIVKPLVRQASRE